jgi:DNA-binding NtrC family response regulator
MKILIVDDDLIVVKSCCRILESEGMEIRTANTVEMGEKILAEDIFDLLLTDIKMPGRDGFEMIQCAKTLRPDMPVLMMTGYLTSDIIDQSRGFGVDNYIAKPFTPTELLEAVQKSQTKGI